jgi:acetyl esterase/lipase
MSEISEKIRKMFQEGDDIRDAGLTTPEDVIRYDDILYGSDPKWQALDVYRPKEKNGQTLPVIVSIHGGAWMYGDKERYQYYCMSLAQQGFAVVNYTYRLAPEFQFPAAIEDANLVFGWVLEHAKEYRLDTAHIFAVGDSAGAHQLGLYCNLLTNPDYAAKYSFQPPKGLKITAVALNCGVYEIDLSGQDDPTSGEVMREYLPNHGTPEELDTINVVNHVTEDFPSAFVMTCTGDFLINQAPMLVKTLIEKKVPHVFRFYGNAEKELGHVFHCNMKLEEAHACNRDECEFFKSFL